MLPKIEDAPDLTQTEITVVVARAAGLTSKQTGELYGFDEQTANKYFKRMRDRTGYSGSQLVYLLGYQQGMKNANIVRGVREQGGDAPDSN